MFVTNNSTKSRQGYTKKFQELGLNVTAVRRRLGELHSWSFPAAAYRPTPRARRRRSSPRPSQRLPTSRPPSSRRIRRRVGNALVPLSLPSLRGTGCAHSLAARPGRDGARRCLASHPLSARAHLPPRSLPGRALPAPAHAERLLTPGGARWLDVTFPIRCTSWARSASRRSSTSWCAAPLRGRQAAAAARGRFGADLALKAAPP